MRKLFINNDTWLWQISKQSTIEIRNPEGKKFLTSLAELKNVTPDEIERAKWKGVGYKCTPGDIREYIKTKIIKRKCLEKLCFHWVVKGSSFAPGMYDNIEEAINNAKLADKDFCGCPFGNCIRNEECLGDKDWYEPY